MPGDTASGQTTVTEDRLFGRRSGVPVDVPPARAAFCTFDVEGAEAYLAEETRLMGRTRLVAGEDGLADG